MTEINASNYDQLVAAVDRLSNEELVAAIQSQEGGVDGTLEQVYQGMVNSFNPQKAAGQQATVQYEIAAPDGPHPYVMRIADGRCEVEKGTAESPRVTLKIGLGDFLRLVTNRLPGMQAFMTGKLKVSGDLFFAQTFASWFDRPAS
ncbi:MAG TPA: SCP2 sterol-binding domain-containing protein [Actinomycetes bacterium]|jgi:putative sterol carrier protein|nr:SCP2 sterol-binding domain-containing protein [Actinomycetes bacterium]